LKINLEQLNEVDLKVKQYPKASLLIVTKNRPQSLVKLLISKGYNLFGENKVQEANEKFSSLEQSNIYLHLIGPLQTNKVKLALTLFDTIQSIDRPKLIKEIAKQINTDNKIKTKDYFIQVNIGQETQKSGVLPDEAKELYKYAISNNLNIVGLMCIPPFNKEPHEYFKNMCILRDDINQDLTLSMGMSNDYDIALSFNSNLVRVGSKIFK
tara:strand:- start:122 stop:754 length:633 start_codon:yes stop_codon:yes gene_type:complete